MIFSEKPDSKNSFLRRDRWSIERIDAPMEQPIHATSLGLKLQETNPQ